MSRVYIGRLPARCTERDIEKFFKGYGRLRDVVLKTGYGFVEFEDDRDAEDAVYDLHGTDLKGERIVVEHARLPPGARGGSRRESRYGPPTRTDYRIIVQNLSSRVSWQDLKDMMRKVGEVTYADAHKQVRNEGYASETFYAFYSIVEFASHGDMKAAIDKYDGYTLYERRLKVFADKPRHRSKSNSRHSRGRRSRSRSRRRSRRSRRSKSYSRCRSSSKRSRSGCVHSFSDKSRSHDSSSSRSVSRTRSRSDRSVSRHSDKKPHRSRSRSIKGSPALKKPRNDSSARSGSLSLARSGSRSATRLDSKSRSASGRRSHSRSPVGHSRSSSKSHSGSCSGPCEPPRDSVDIHSGDDSMEK